MSTSEISASAGDSPEEPLAARMLNEFVYCPRLFYYEHVEGVFIHNADTRRGAARCRRLSRLLRRRNLKSQI